MPRQKLSISALAVVAAVLVAAPAHALDVYAASSLRAALPALDPGARYAFGGSNDLQLQIEHGAPADVFLSAEPKEARALFAEGRCTRPVTFATNTLVILVPRANPGHVRSVYSLRAGGRRIAVGAPGVPIGDYTRQVLRRLRLTVILRRNRVSAEPSVASLTAKVALGSADAGFAYVTDARAVGSRVRAVSLPAGSQPPVRYEACLVHRTAAARSFLRTLVSARGRRVLHRFGFGLPPRG